MQEKTPTTAYITLAVAIIVIIVGYYWWSTSRATEVVEVQNNEQTSNYNTTSPSQMNTPINSAISNPNISTTSPDTATSSPINSTNKSLKNNMHTVTIETNKGTIVFETYDVDAPLASKNFIDLANKGFYTNVIFHRVIEGFMIQGGDPTGTGSGGPGYTFADELNPTTASYKTGYVRGTVAMANAGPNTNGSQFFIMHKDTSLPHNYTIFGKVVKGMDVVDAIATTQTVSERPVEKIVMKKVTVTENK